MNTITETEQSKGKNKGFTLIELLIVIVILGILAAVTVFAVRGITDKGKTSACSADKNTLETAVESYFAQYGSTSIASTGTAVPGSLAATIPATANAVITKPTGATWTAGANGGATLVAAGFLRAAPSKYFVSVTGDLYVLDAACGGTGSLAT